MNKEIFKDGFINCLNLFEIPEKYNLCFLGVQTEIFEQFEHYDFLSVKELLDKEVNVVNEIRYVNNLSIRDLLNEFIDDEDLIKNMINNDTGFVKCYFITGVIQDLLIDIYKKGKGLAILPFKMYENEYSNLLKGYLKNSFDNDELDFIKQELSKIDLITVELDKSIYNKVFINGVGDEDCDFKIMLKSSLEKRKRFLNSRKEYVLNIVKKELLLKNDNKRNYLQKIEHYKESYSFFALEIVKDKFNEDKQINSLYYLDNLNHFKSDLLKRIEVNKVINVQVKTELKFFCNDIFKIFNDIFSLFNIINNYSLNEDNSQNLKNGINRYESYIENDFNDLERYVNYLKSCLFYYSSKEVLFIKGFFTTSINELIFFFKTEFGIRLNDSPLKLNISNFLTAVENSVSVSELKLLDKDVTISSNKPSEKQNNVLESLKDVSSIDLRKKIEDYYSFLLEEDENKKRQRLSDSDFNKFVNWLVYFYENDCKVPEIDEPINDIYANKGLIRFSLMDFYKNKMAKGNYCDALFDFYRCVFYPYRNENTDTIKKNRVLPEYRKIVNSSN
ncbi:hypothetical protein [Tenacibaculum geojense]|uniref:Uncharacterized protein n=1 Tax=Tenacibaculum geojense TaxID=915352 RepID=A0ABW3JRS3_9FLAO